jgi:2-isopropylmalate synthase
MRGRSHDLIYDWNEVDGAAPRAATAGALFDETLRDGLQNPSVVDPPVARKIELLHWMAAIGIQGANLGMPVSSRRAFDDTVRMAKEVAAAKLDLTLGCAGRTVVGDITSIVEASQKSGVPIEAFIFTASSPIRQVAESWDVAELLTRSSQAIDTAVRAGLDVCFITEDTTRSRPDVLRALFGMAIDRGAARVCVADTTGHATTAGVRNVLRFVRNLVDQSGARVSIDWHGHNDRGLALDNALAALASGADRVHGTALGIGERVGNAPMELILLNLKLQGELETQDLTRVLDYCLHAARSLEWQIPRNHPLVGADAFRTATGVHAAAILKARAKGDDWLADRIYSSVPAGSFGRKQEICIGFMSGSSNVTYWLRQRDIEPTPSLVGAILAVAKHTDHILSDEEVMRVVEQTLRAPTTGATPRG